MSYYTTYETSNVYDCDPPVANGKENTGRWTAEEHRLFLQGLELHGKGWKKIASLIRTRTVVQIRTHAQKYFQKLAKVSVRLIRLGTDKGQTKDRQRNIKDRQH